MIGPHSFFHLENLPTSFNGEPETWRHSEAEGVTVSSLGRSFNDRTNRFLKGAVTSKERPTIVLTIKCDGVKKYFSLARLVAQAFVPVPDHLQGKKLQVRHVDGNLKNNRASNLTWTQVNQNVDRGDDFVPDVFPAEVKEPSGQVHQERWTRFRGSQYYVSTLGRVFSAKSMDLLTPQQSKTGYWRVPLSGIGGLFLHRLVAESFLANPENLPVVNHKDADPSNNCLWNVEWATHQRNTQHAVEHGLIPTGQRHPHAAFTDEEVSELRAIYAGGGYTFQSLADDLRVSRSTVARAITGLTLYIADHDPVSTNHDAEVVAKAQAAKERWESTRAHREALKQERKEHRGSKLKLQEVLAIRELASAGRRPQEIADVLNRPLHSVQAVLHGRAYEWATSPESIAPKPGPKNLVEKAERGQVERVIVTPALIQDAIRLRMDKLTAREIASRLGLHPGTVKLIVGNRHPLQRDGRAQLMPDLPREAVRGSITPEVIEEVYRRHFVNGEPMYKIGRDLGIKAPSQVAIRHGKHYLQREGAVRDPDSWLRDNVSLLPP